MSVKIIDTKGCLILKRKGRIVKGWSFKELEPLIEENYLKKLRKIGAKNAKITMGWMNGKDNLPTYKHQDNNKRFNRNR